MIKENILKVASFQSFDYFIARKGK